MKAVLLAGGITVLLAAQPWGAAAADDYVAPAGPESHAAGASDDEIRLEPGLWMAQAEVQVAQAAPAAAEEPPVPEVFADLGGIEVLGDDRNYLEIGAGVFDALKEEAEARRSAGASLELRGGSKLGFIGPAAGVIVNTDGGVYGYGGVYMDLRLGPVVLTPQAGIGAYHQGDSSDLGGVFQFRIGAGLTYQFDNGWRLGLSFAHISNAGIYEDNGGVEEIYLILGIPFTL
jgi:hypothetical protein